MYKTVLVALTAQQTLAGFLERNVRAAPFLRVFPALPGDKSRFSKVRRTNTSDVDASSATPGLGCPLDPRSTDTAERNRISRRVPKKSQQGGVAYSLLC